MKIANDVNNNAAKEPNLPQLYASEMLQEIQERLNHLSLLLSEIHQYYSAFLVRQIAKMEELQGYDEKFGAKTFRWLLDGHGEANVDTQTDGTVLVEVPRNSKLDPANKEREKLLDAAVTLLVEIQRSRPAKYKHLILVKSQREVR